MCVFYEALSPFREEKRSTFQEDHNTRGIHRMCHDDICFKACCLSDLHSEKDTLRMSVFLLGVSDSPESGHPEVVYLR